MAKAMCRELAGKRRERKGQVRNRASGMGDVSHAQACPSGIQGAGEDVPRIETRSTDAPAWRFPGRVGGESNDRLHGVE